MIIFNAIIVISVSFSGNHWLTTTGDKSESGIAWKRFGSVIVLNPRFFRDMGMTNYCDSHNFGLV